MDDIKKEALKIRKQGLSVFSTKTDKTPVIKRANRIVELRTKPQSEKEIEIDFGQPLVAGIAINCGPVPNQDKDLECLDIDCPKLAKTFLDELNISNPNLGNKLKGCVETTPSEGLHIFYYLPLGKSKCKELAMMSTENSKAWCVEAKARGSHKLIAPPIIETRGAGGYVVGFFSKAISKIDGTVKPYTMVFGSVDTIPLLNAEEHDFLMSFAQSYDEKSIKKFNTVNPDPIHKYEIDKKSALEQWRMETSWNEVLPESYRLTEVRPDYFICWHPDSTGSAPNAVAGSKSGGLDRYWNFSPLDWRLPSNMPLTKDYVFCLSRGWNPGSREFKAFYKKIFDKYCPTDDSEIVDETRWEDFDFKDTTNSKIKTKKFLDVVPDDSISFPGWIDIYVDYCMRNALYPEKRIAVASALGLFSALVGRSIMGPGEMKLNLYIVVLGLTANGKDFPRKLNARICMEIDCGDLLMTKVGSREGLEEKVMQGPKFLMADEGAFDLEKAKSGDVRFSDIMGTMLELFTANYIKKRARAGDESEENFIRYPFLSVMTSSTPEEYFKALSPKMLRSGFYNRLLILQASIRGRMNLSGISSQEPIPRYLIDTATKLLMMNENLIAGKTKAFVEELEIEKEFGNEVLNKVENDSRILELTSEALEYFGEQVWKNDDMYTEYQKKGEEEKASSCARLPELALKIGCLWELSRNIDAKNLSLEAITAGFNFVVEVNKRQTANTVMISDTKFGEITDKLLTMISNSSKEIEPGIIGIRMIDAKKLLRKIVHNGQSVDDAIRYLQDTNEISVRKKKDSNGPGSMYLVITNEHTPQSMIETVIEKKITKGVQ